MISLVLEMMWHQFLDCLQKERAGHWASQHDVSNCGWELLALGHKRSPYYLCASRSTKWSLLSVGSFSCHSKIILFRQRAQSRTELSFSHMHWWERKKGKKKPTPGKRQFGTWLWVLAGVTASSLPPGAHGEGTCCGGLFAEGLHLRTDHMKKDTYAYSL